MYLKRKIQLNVQQALSRGKSVLLLGARQTGKTTFIQKQIKPNIYYSFVQPAVRQQYEKNPSLLGGEIEAEIRQKQMKDPIVVIDEIQRVPIILDVIQDLIDRQLARFILTGSSARKLKHGANVNLLPGRVVLIHLDPLLLTEMLLPPPSLSSLLLYGSLPGIFMEISEQDKNIDLNSYVKTYLEEEIRAEALVRNVGSFAKFLFLAANESGKLINLSKLSQEIGVAHTTIATYYQILEDCLLAERIEPLTHSSTRSRLSKAPKILLFDLGVRRLCAEEGVHLPIHVMANLFEQFIGLELIRYARLQQSLTKILYWRDHAGPEVDYVIQQDSYYVPIEVKWNERPTVKDCRHLEIFLQEYKNTKEAYIVCQTPKRFLLRNNITAIPWQEIHFLFDHS
ncbi:MAG: hypothetical protein A3F42_05780 [Gammaproteobacteria bacterium RIFCSPHIGHO2_12_FULL_37_34]|nr:MAG: hypothetical protein A3F42_05780 [Gammaproteobacteria bacterium RIFCSPHIGHO2_12_FULL_37_34]